MSDSKTTQDSKLPLAPQGHDHIHPNGRRCCGRPITEKCSPDEEASKTNAAGEKSCCNCNHDH